MRRTALMALLAAWVAVLAPQSVARSDTLAGFGIVLLHGKGGQPGGLIGDLAAALQAEGATVLMPKMPWSGSGGRPDKYDVTYDQAMSHIGKAVAQVKAKGATKIVVAGQSLGANAAIGYAARHGAGLAAVIALAPGHTPERMGRPELVQGVAKARGLLTAGRGNDVVMLPDLNQGETFQVRATPVAYLSFFDPNGPAVIPRNAAAMPSIPFLWVIGNRDRLAGVGRGYAFDRAAKHSKSRYAVINADHRDTPTAARSEVIAWLKSL